MRRDRRGSRVVYSGIGYNAAGLNAAHLGRIESGLQAAERAKVADALDKVLPERQRLVPASWLE